MPVLTHDVVRRNGGAWKCVNCEREGASIAEVNAIPCSKQSTGRDGNVVDAVLGRGKFSKAGK